VRGFGYVLLGIGVLVLLATFTIGVARNLSVLVLVSSSTPVLFIVFSLLLMRVGRTNKEEKASWLITYEYSRITNTNTVKN
jgi:hypothetical protein